MLKKADFSKAIWIGTGVKSFPVNIQSEFDIDKNEKATITIGCMGTFKLYINGKKVSDDLFLPLNTDFEERYNIEYGDLPFEEKLAHRLYCPYYDISEYLKEGKNIIDFMLAPGFYEFYDYGTAKICWKIDITNTDGASRQIFSDGTEKYKEIFVKEANMITGETHDYTDADKLQWQDVKVMATPDTPCYLQDCPADKIARIIKPKYLGNNIYDAGEIFTGYPVLKSNKAQTVKVRYSELLNEDGTLDEMHIYGQHTDYITDENERLLCPEFTWLCFRYFEVIGDVEVTECAVIHSDIEVTSEFECDNEILNWLRKAYIRTQLANMHCGIPSDCPHTERRGYTGDGQLTCAASMMQLDAQKFYKKWIADICDCQDQKTGHIQYTAPFVPSGGGPGGWGCAIVMVPYEYYRSYCEKEIFEETFPKMLKWIEYMEMHSENELVTSDLPGVWCLGDWCAPSQNQLNKLDGMIIPRPYVNTYFYVKSMEIFLKICDITGNDQYKTEIQNRIKTKKKAITEIYFCNETGDFADNEQGANAFAIDLGLGDERTFDNMIKKYTEIGKYDTGIFGTDIVTRILFEKGRADVAFSLLTSKEDVSYYNQILGGATTLLEYWNGVRSQCHPMFGAVTRYLFEYIIGIRQDKDSYGYEKVIIEPVCMKYLPNAKGKIKTIKGEISVEYNRTELIATIPENINAVLRLNYSETLLTAGTNTFKT
ncbi:MAG: family 78 glycoside hydrolase catalytic domain [Clostridia bacterium]|nr:family 78 glycoside hydrolase catalytic domain [Clostridia bacterium]